MKKYYLKYKNIKDIQKVYIDVNWNGYFGRRCYKTSEGYKYLIENLNIFIKGLTPQQVDISDRITSDFKMLRYIENSFPLELFEYTTNNEELE